MHPSLLIDLGAAPDCCVDHGLEALYKSLGERQDESIWEPHQDPRIAGHIEDVTRRGLRVLSVIEYVMLAGLLAKADPWLRPTEVELQALWDRLAAIPPAARTLDDWLGVIDYALGRYLPEQVIRDEADYLAIRAVFAGRIQAAIDHPRMMAAVAAVVSASPTTITAAVGAARFTGRVAAVLQFARQRAADLIVDLKDATRRRLRRVIVEHEEARALGEPRTPGQLEQGLREQFGELNRDWRRIAVTEAGRDANEAFIASLPEGSRVRRLEQYPTACPFCKRIHNLELTVVSPSKPDKNGWTEVWVGKSNVGRSAAPRKKVGNLLIERTPEELYWPPAGLAHPHCRGRWLHLEHEAVPEGVDPQFAEWLQAQLAAVTKV
jgi:hypothetical protein